MMATFGHAVAEWVAAMWTYALIIAALVVSHILARHSGRVAERRDIDAGRVRVFAAMETASATTVVIIPAQRPGGSS